MIGLVVEILLHCQISNDKSHNLGANIFVVSQAKVNYLISDLGTSY